MVTACDQVMEALLPPIRDQLQLTGPVGGWQEAAFVNSDPGKPLASLHKPGQTQRGTDVPLRWPQARFIPGRHTLPGKQSQNNTLGNTETVHSPPSVTGGRVVILPITATLSKEKYKSETKNIILK